jgi:hypothetical protein
MSNPLTITVTGVGKDINNAYAYAYNDLLMKRNQAGMVATITGCTEHKEISPYKPAQRTTKVSSVFKGQKKWKQVWVPYVMNEQTGMWMRAVVPEDIDSSVKAGVQSYTRELCLKFQCQTCVRVERVLEGDENNQVEETFTPENVKMGTWNFMFEYTEIPKEPAAS